VATPSYLTAHLSAPQIIEKNTKVRLKIVGTRVDATEIVCLALNILAIPIPYDLVASLLSAPLRKITLELLSNGALSILPREKQRAAYRPVVYGGVWPQMLY